ncbi:conserved hypothetical protein [Chthoniobacter flavus Ellin428]|uniref:Transporter n=1 Tax=Chthoniobacter flavus Ellin428 TaxID=497964 RepID=B4DAC9_9BACT|nr:transporter [Chthoniobacter flavus]EDY16590.1 conserved hypothetical protein [Chthoniobacter flavus Ellin428]TCO91988.1 outer membrane putative beta-barrel porin/alpha-amylase [Chthoniobacter flavus]
MLPSTQRFPLLTGLAILTASLAGTAHAGPPFVTDDPEPVEYRHWEVMLATQQFHNADGWSGTAPHLEINYGVIPDVQLHVITPLAYNKAPGEPAHFGIGNIELGVKYRFLHETDSIPQVGFFPLVEVPTMNRAEGLSTEKAQVFLPIWLQKKFGNWTTYGGGGYWFNPGPGNRDYWYAGWEVQRKITESFTAGMEIQFRTPDSVDGHTSTALNAGGIWDLSDTYHILFSAGHTVQGPSEFQGYLAFQITFGPKEEKDDKDGKSKK